MRRQRNMAPMKKQKKTPEKELNEMEITNVSEAEFQTLVIRMLKELTEYGNKIKKTQGEMKFTLSEIKNNLQGNNSRGMNLRFKSMIWNIWKQKTTNQKKK